MKTGFQFKTIFRLLSVMFMILVCGFLFAQDGNVVADPSEAPLSLPTWMSTGFTIAAIVLPTLQALLKMVPTQRSIRISGFIGKLLDVTTFFISDKRKGGGKHL